MVTKWLRRNRISSPLLSSRFWRNIRRLRKYLAPRSLSFRFLPCPALPFRDYASNFCNRFACSNFFTVRKRKVDQKSGYPLDYAIGCTVHVPPPLDPRIYAIIQTVYLWTERAFLVFVFSFFSLSLIEYALPRNMERAISARLMDGFGRFQDVNETPFQEAPERAGTRRRWNSSAPRNSDITLILVIARSITCACLAELCSSPAREDWCTGGYSFQKLILNSNRREMAFRESEFADGKKEGRDEYGRKHFHTNFRLKSFSCA